MSSRSPVVAIDADVLILSLSRDHRLGPTSAAVFDDEESFGLLGSTLLLGEVLVRPLRLADDVIVERILDALARVDLFPPDEDIAIHAAWLRTRYGLKTVDAVHLSTSILRGADAFFTNNQRDFARDEIEEIAVFYPQDLNP